MNLKNRIDNKIIELQKKAHYCYLSKRNKNLDFTIISQNCIGGVIYHLLGMEFRTPTINMFIEDENFVKLVENLDYYLHQPAKPLNDCYIDPIDSSVHYPKILVDDIEICCQHYKNCDEAILAWEKRKKRVNYNNVYVIGNSWNMHENKDWVARIAHCKYKSVVFTYGDFEGLNCIKLKGNFWKLDQRGIVRPNLTDSIPNSPLLYFEKQFDFIRFLND